MKKTELIKKAINNGVLIECFDGDYMSGWLVVDNDNHKQYLVLPFMYSIKTNIPVIKVSYIKHIKYVSNQYKLW